MKPIDQLRHTRDELRRQLEANEVFVAWYEVDEAVRRAEAKLGGDARPADLACSPARAKRVNVWTTEYEEMRRTGPDALEASYTVIATTMRPHRTDELVAAIEAEGVRLNGKNPLKVFRTRLSKDDRFRSIQIGPSQKTDRAWWLSGLAEPVPDFSPPAALPDLSRGSEPQKDSAPAGVNPAEAVNGSGGG